MIGQRKEETSGDRIDVVSGRESEGEGERERERESKR